MMTQYHNEYMESNTEGVLHGRMLSTDIARVA